MDYLDWVAVAGLGGLVGMGELVSRYRDAPERALVTPPALVYVVLNVAASAAALALIRAFGLSFGGPVGATASNVHVGEVLAAGLGAMLILRSSIFMIRTGGQDVPIGPSSFLQIFLAAADRGVDRIRARRRAELVGEAMAGVSYQKAIVALPTYCLGLMQNLSSEDQQKFSDQLKELQNAPMPEDVKVLSLGLAIINLLGYDALQAAVDSLDYQVNDAISRGYELMKGVSFAKAQEVLPDFCASLVPSMGQDKVRSTRAAVEQLRQAKIDDQAKAIRLGVLLLKTVGEEVLTVAITALGERIREPARTVVVPALGATGAEASATAPTDTSPGGPSPVAASGAGVGGPSGTIPQPAPSAPTNGSAPVPVGPVGVEGGVAAGSGAASEGGAGSGP